jgi:hypothetical protein
VGSRADATAPVLPPAQFSLHIFGFGCPENASLRILCRHEQVLQLDYAAWTVTQLRPGPLFTTPHKFCCWFLANSRCLCWR